MPLRLLRLRSELVDENCTCKLKFNFVYFDGTARMKFFSVFHSSPVVPTFPHLFFGAVVAALWRIFVMFFIAFIGLLEAGQKFFISSFSLNCSRITIKKSLCSMFCTFCCSLLYV